MILPLLIIGLSQFATFLTFMHFMYSVSEIHAFVVLGLFVLQKFGEVQVIRSNKNGGSNL